MQAWLGGTFDPVHNGHLRVALDVAEALETTLNLLPCNVPPHHKQPQFSATQRLAMLTMAVTDEPALQVDDRELQRSGLSYTVDTLTELREELGSQPLCWVMGYDSFVSLPEWNRWTELFDLAHLVVCSRPGDAVELSAPLAREMKERQVTSANALRASKAGKIWCFEPTQLRISATDIRQRIAAGRSLRYLLPERVAQQVKEFSKTN